MNFVTFHRSEIPDSLPQTPVQTTHYRQTTKHPSISTTSTQLVRCFLHIEYRPLLLPSYPIIPQHPTILPSILALKVQHRLWRKCFQDIVIIAMWAVLVAFLELLGVFSEAFLTFLARECLVDSQVRFCLHWIFGKDLRGRESLPYRMFGGEDGIRFRRGIPGSRTIFGSRERVRKLGR